MTRSEIAAKLRTAYRDAAAPKKLVAAMTALFFLSALYPSDTAYYSARQKDRSAAVKVTDHAARHISAAAQAAIPFFLCDGVGIAQAVYVAAGTTIATQTLKRVFNGWTVGGTRLGQRPYSESSSQNMPSGHSSMASSAMYFVIRRYGWKHAWYLVPLTFLTMYARIALKAHTLSAVVAGCLLGMIVAAFFTSVYKKPPAPDCPGK